MTTLLDKSDAQYCIFLIFGRKLYGRLRLRGGSVALIRITTVISQVYGDFASLCVNIDLAPRTVEATSAARFKM